MAHARHDDMSASFGRYLAGRIAGLTMVILVLTAATFGLMHQVPGGPFVSEKHMPPEAIANINRKYGLDQPIYVQYVKWLGAVVQGDFGIPFQSPTETVVSVIARAWPVTLAVGAITIAIAYGFGIFFGVVAALWQNSWIDRTVTFVSTLGLTLPNFIIGFLLVYFLSVKFRLLPTGGWGKPTHLIMPVIAYSLGPMAIVARYTRTSMLEVLRSEYVRLARARGIPWHRILVRYVLRNALVPLITVLGPNIPDVLTGSIFIEGMFSIPGLGRFFTSSALFRDYPMIMAMMLLVAVLWGVTYILSDFLYGLADPRMRVGGSER